MIPRMLIVLAIIAAVLQGALLWGTEVPLGVNGEWTWPRIAYSTQHLFGWLTCGIVGGVYLLVFWLGALRNERAQRLEIFVWLIVLCTMGFIWVMNVVAISPDPAGLGRVPFVLYYPRSSGYFWQARYEVTNLREFLKTYQESISDPTKPDNYLHIGTHPPGLTAAYFSIRELCITFPAVQNLILATEPGAVGEAFSTIEANALQSGRHIDSADRACLWLSGLIVLSCIALVSLPLYLLVLHSTGNKLWAWMIAALWPLVPSASIFFPKSDLIFPLIAITAQYFWLLALDRKSTLLGAVSALTLITGMLLSLALLPVAAMFGVQTVLHSIQGANFKANSLNAQASGSECNEPEASALPLIMRYSLYPTIGALATVALCVGLISYFAEMNLLGIWLQNVRNHSAFYDHSSRTYLSWLWVNPFELIFSLGSVLVVVLIGKVLANRRLFTGTNPAWGALIVWGLLWLSGKNMGEAARLWCFQMPLLLWAFASLGVAPAQAASEENSDPDVRHMLTVLALQMVVCVATASRVDGFHLAQL